MAKITLRFGLALVALGMASYALAGGSSPTALIPSIFGVLLLLCGFTLARDAAAKGRSGALPAAMTVAALGLLAVTPRVLRGASKLLEEPGLGAASQLMLFVGLASYLVLALRHLLKKRS